MPFNISTFTSNFDGGARSNLFQIQITGLPQGVTPLSFEDQFVHVKAIQLPETTVGEIPVNHMGRIYKFPGDRIYNDVQLTILSDGTNMRIRHFFEEWNHVWNRHFDNQGLLPVPDSFNAVVTLSQLDRTHAPIRQYHLQRAWCSDVSAVDLSHDNQDALVEFTVSLKYHYFQVNTNTSGSAGTSLASSAGRILP
jgi:hypothetical protein